MQALTISAWLRWDVIRRLLPPDADSLLEIGAGLGGTGVMLAQRYAYTGIEPDEVSHAVASRRNPGRVLRQRLEEHEGLYDVVCAFEVLEHIEDDLGALRAWRERSRRWLLLSVPMNPGQWGAGDEHVGHYRRYTRQSLGDALAASGWTPRRMVAYGFPAGNALETTRNRLAARARDPESQLERTNASGRWLQPADAAAPVVWAGALPFRLLQRPFDGTSRGIGLVALASR